MTKQEYNEKRTELLQTCATENDYYVASNKLREEYIASLESENATLTLLHSQATDQMLTMQNRIHELESEVAKLNRALDVAAESLNHIACGCPKDECDTCVVSDNCTHKTVMNYADCWREYALAEAEEKK